MVMSSCPECQASIELGQQPEIGQFITCSECNRKLEVVWLFPVYLDFAEEEFPLSTTLTAVNPLDER